MYKSWHKMNNKKKEIRKDEGMMAEWEKRKRRKKNKGDKSLLIPFSLP